MRVPQKNFGDASLHPRTFRSNSPEEAYLFFLAFFLAFFFAAILFSSRNFEISRQRCWRSAYSVIMYSDCAHPCQEESEFWSNFRRVVLSGQKRGPMAEPQRCARASAKCAPDFRPRVGRAARRLSSDSMMMCGVAGSTTIGLAQSSQIASKVMWIGVA